MLNKVHQPLCTVHPMHRLPEDAQLDIAMPPYSLITLCSQLILSSLEASMHPALFLILNGIGSSNREPPSGTCQMNSISLVLDIVFSTHPGLSGWDRLSIETYVRRDF